ncbi:MAG: DUF2189 domain-containing protein, partial [Candidatus Competibacteraceae bacterium]|nr:DUF2189 domain-containing protein [Candidatus Competibacteraceae bacterium]
MRQPSTCPPGPGRESVAATIARWLGQGWRDFRRTPALSMGFSALFLLIGAGVTLALLAQGRPLLAFPFLAGFPLLAPLFALGFYQMARVLDKGGRPAPADLLRGFTRPGAGAWAIALLLVFCYFIWITDALLLYALYFGTGREWDAWIGFQDPALVERTTGFLFFAGLTGLVLALGLFMVAVLSLPRLFIQGGSFIT